MRQSFVREFSLEDVPIILGFDRFVLFHAHESNARVGNL